MPFTRKGVPFTRKGVPFTREGVPFIREGVPFTREGVPFIREGVPFTREGVPFTREGAGRAAQCCEARRAGHGARGRRRSAHSSTDRAHASASGSALVFFGSKVLLPSVRSSLREKSTEIVHLRALACTEVFHARNPIRLALYCPAGATKL